MFVNPVTLNYKVEDKFESPVPDTKGTLFRTG